MKLQDVGRIVNTHGLRGEVKLELWCDSPDFLRQFGTLYIGGTPRRLTAVRPQGGSASHAGMAILKLEGVDSVEEAQAIKSLVAQADVSGVKLPEGRYFVSDLIGIDVLDDATGKELGTLADVLFQPAHDVYVIRRADGSEMLIPAVEAFVKSVDIGARVMRVETIEGM